MTLRDPRRRTENEERTTEIAWKPRSSRLAAGAVEAVLVGLLLICVNVQVATAEGSIGCLFAQSVCIKDVEMCFDDYAFGKCVSRFGNDEEDLRRSRLNMGQSKVLATMLQEMQGADLTWDHPFVQCRMQGALFALRERMPMPPNLCGHLAPPPPETLIPKSPLAYVRFTSPEEDENEQENDVEQQIQEYLIGMPPEEFYMPQKKSALSQRVFLDRGLPPTDHDDLDILNRLRKVNVDEEQENSIDPEEMAKLMREAERRALADDDPILPIYRGDFMFPELERKMNEEAALDEMLEDVENNRRLEQILQETPEDAQPHTSFREVARVEHIPAVSYYRQPQLEELGDSDWQLNEGSFPQVFVAENKEDTGVEQIPIEDSPNVSGIYTEGGVVYLPPGQEAVVGDVEEEEEQNEDDSDAHDMLANMLGFTRHERLDVKKPGPMVIPPEPVVTPSSSTSSPQNKEVLPAIAAAPAKTKKLIIEGHQTDDHGVHSVDSQYAHVKFTTPVDNWRDGERIVQAIGEQVNLAAYLSHIRVDQHEVSFRVDTNPEMKTAADVARAINDPRFKSNLSRRLGVNVLYAGIGDKTQANEWNEKIDKKMVTMAGESDINSTQLMIYMFVGAGVAAILVGVITLFVIKRHDKVRSKLLNLTGGMTGATPAGGVDSSKDYQELCRARMAGKGVVPAAGNEGAVTSGRITSLSKENERPPSSRSSTSSWSEEPMTNMDISTGHMVLSYMEDHLRNKGRLQREWEALCRYEAEPNSRDVAMQESCVKMNRDGAPLPYDHSRVVLNHLVNADGIDYINASTITDHDPRAPAYVAAQGPMQSTVAHFWQMVWEQGTVVIVALCRLQENGEIACTRYWPEEGAETYHIYEVHLVSEHIWCDDYLVRSFYLKNLQTGETRTVTQFHFLTWPQMGVPASAKPLLEFRRKVNKSYRGRSCPIIVHSGNGAGRTGAYILLDLVLGRMNKGAREIDIAATLEHLRDQRAGLVETRPQFEFVLMAVAEEVHMILKALPNSTSTEKRDIEKDPVKGETEQPEEKKKEEEKEKKNGPATTEKKGKK